MAGDPSRRQFLAAAGAVALSAATYRRVLGAAERVGVGFVGTGGRGRSLIRAFRKNKEADVVSVCDVYAPHLDAAVKEASGKVKKQTNYRRVLDDKEVQAVVIATPDHWHNDQLLRSVKAEKDVYLEKPMALSVEQGAKMVKAVRDADRVVQLGMQRRSAAAIYAARRILRDGTLGRVALVRAQWYWNMPALQKERPLKGKLDWSAFCGPAGEVELSRGDYQNVAFWNWRYFWPFSGGNMTDQGTHLMDVIQWFLADSKPPKSAVCQGQVRRLEPSETPDVFSAVFEYEEFLATWTLAYTNSYKDGWQIVFQGDRATLELDGEGCRLYEDPGRGKPLDKPIKEEKAPMPTEPHVDNFLECLKARRDPNAPVEVG